jgi:signal transduction histidine kinase
VVQFLAVGALLLVGGLWATQWFGVQVAETEAIADASVTTEVLAHSVAEPAIPRGMIHGDAGAIDRFDRTVLERLLVDQVRRIKIWDAEGTVVYSDETELIGQQFPLDEEQHDVLWSGRTEGSVSPLRDRENAYEVSDEGLVEVYTRIHAPEGDPLLFEVYYSVDDIHDRTHEILEPFRTLNATVLLLTFAVATPIIWILTRRLTAASRERESLLEAVVDASDGERRRIARDLHDGVVQDLAGTTFELAALERSSTGATATTLGDATGRLRRALRSLRSLMVEIHPPDLGPAGLASALEDLTAPVHAAGIDTEVRVSGADGLDDDTVRLVWRVAQEAVRNALRHARPGRVDIVVDASQRTLLTVTDDGQGFDPAAAGRPDSLGLRGLASLVAEAGGRLDVRSTPGKGTTVVLEMSR